MFGDLDDPSSRVSQLLARAPRTTTCSSELGTRPNVGYLTKVRNREEA